MDKNIILDNIKFKTKKELKEYIKKLLKKRGLFNISVNDNDFIFFKDLLYRNSKYSNIDVIGFKNTYDILSGFINKLYYIDNNNNEYLFSWNKCIIGKSSNNYDKLIKAYRSSIQPQITFFKNNTKHICNKCGNNNICQVDHVIEFIELVKKFNELNNYIPIKFIKNKIGINCFIKDDIDYENKWINFHKNNAILQLLCISCHNYKTNNY